MECLRIRGGVPLRGTVRPSGAKNAVLKLMAAALLTDAPCVLRGVPDIVDVHTMLELLQATGATVRWDGQGDLHIQAAGALSGELPDRLVAAMRASAQLMGPLVARGVAVRLATPGGCDIGERPLDLHLRGLAAMGVRVRQEGGTVELLPPRQLAGAEVVLEFPSVGATENLMTAATLARGTTVIRNAAREPEVVELQSFLRAMGARVEGAGEPVVRVQGVPRLGGARWEVMPDRIETATWMVASAITRGQLRIAPARPEQLGALVQALRQAGVTVLAAEGELKVDSSRVGRYHAVDVTAQPYPGFPTDAQPMWTALMSLATGVSVIREQVYSRRFGYVQELWRMGADVRVEGRVAVVRGVARLRGAAVQARDLRGGAALLLAALAADGESLLTGLHHLQRGYERLADKLEALGARVAKEVVERA